MTRTEDDDPHRHERQLTVERALPTVNAASRTVRSPTIPPVPQVSVIEPLDIREFREIEFVRGRGQGEGRISCLFVRDPAHSFPTLRET